MSLPLFVDSDNALGSPFGDVDDGFALAALWRSPQKLEGVSSTYGNTSEERAFANHSTLGRLCGYSGPLLHGAEGKRQSTSEGADHLVRLQHPVRVLALGPLTTLAQAVRRRTNLSQAVKEVVFLGTNYHHRMPAVRIFDFNFSRDFGAVTTVLQSDLALTCVPNDVARRLRMGSTDLSILGGELGDYLRRYSRRWFWRARLLKAGKTVPVWDLVPTLYVLHPELFEVRKRRVKLSWTGAADFNAELGREVTVVVDFDPKIVWNTFLGIMQ